MRLIFFFDICQNKFCSSNRTLTEKRPSKSGHTQKNIKKGHFSNPVKESAIVGHSAFFNTLFLDPTFVLFFCSPFEDGKARMFVDESNFPEADSSFNRIRKQTFDQSKAHSKVGTIYYINNIKSMQIWESLQTGTA